MLDEKYAVTSVGGSTASASNAVSTPTHVVLPNAPAVPAPASTNPPSKFADRYAERLAELRQQVCWSVALLCVPERIVYRRRSGFRTSYKIPRPLHKMVCNAFH